jgi:predicted RecA/RadA family phage recombinase
MPNAHLLSGEDVTEIDLSATDADAAAAGDRDRAIVKGIFQLPQSLIGPW